MIPRFFKSTLAETVGWCGHPSPVESPPVRKLEVVLLFKTNLVSCPVPLEVKLRGLFKNLKSTKRFKLIERLGKELL